MNFKLISGSFSVECQNRKALFFFDVTTNPTVIDYIDACRDYLNTISNGALSLDANREKKKAILKELADYFIRYVSNNRPNADDDAIETQLYLTNDYDDFSFIIRHRYYRAHCVTYESPNFTRRCDEYRSSVLGEYGLIEKEDPNRLVKVSCGSYCATIKLSEAKELRKKLKNICDVTIDESYF